MGTAELAIEKRMDAIEDDAQPLHTSERSVSKKAENCFYCNIPSRVSKRMNLTDESTVVIDEYRDKIVIRTED
jgi:hypothetical protein